jgi:cytochrome c-type biogenesis protein CcmE
MFYYLPKDVAAGAASAGHRFRLGGIVVKGSVEREGLKLSFKVTDGVADVPVRYEGIVPDLFKEGQGVIVRGTLSADGALAAEEVLAKHDENYRPPGVSPGEMSR